jgi:aldehyde dehydrogenase (NAD+)
MSNLSDLIAKTRKSQISWSADPLARSAALSKLSKLFSENREALVASMVEEVKKPITEARGELNRAISILDFYSAAVLDSDGETFPATSPNFILSIRRPYGVAGLITPWNFPIAIPFWKAAPALAMGNAVIIKPSEFSSNTALLFAKFANEVFPEGVFTVMPGDGQIGKSLIDHSDVASFTGSARVGKEVISQSAKLGIPVQAEMGGHNPALVLPDADLNLLATQFPIAAFSYSGQKCTATRRVIVVGDKKRRDEVAEVLISATKSLQVGDANDEKTFVGPLIHSAAREGFERAVAESTKVGKLAFGGETVDAGKNLVSPAITTDVPLDHQLMCEEVFAPIVHVANVHDVSAAIKLANDVPYGLTASIHTQDLAAAFAISKALETGMVKVNGPTAGVDFYAPFGGLKDSSYGAREQGKAALEFYSHTQTVTVNVGKGKFPC